MSNLTKPILTNELSLKKKEQQRVLSIVVRILCLKADFFYIQKV